VASAGTNELIAVGAARALTGAPMLLAALGLSTATRPEDDPDDEARVLDALAASPSDPDALARRLGLSTPALAAIVARLVIRGRIGTAADGRLARR
jgi:predicted Rossmann fold nucleotide-binding protein DprA/Smf involved in DNA uptake